MSELLNLQFEFAERVSLIPGKVRELDMRVKFGEILRSNEQAEINALGRVGRAELCRAIDESWPGLALAISDNVGSGIRKSQHCRALALDLQLFGSRDGSWVYLRNSQDYETLGRWWCTLHESARWGGDFQDPDGGHFSFEWRGVK